MRHRIAGKQLNRDSEHRRAMFRNLAAGLFEHGEIETTRAKAKAVQPFVEKIITIAKKDTFAARRRLESILGDRKIHAWVADPNVPDAKKDNAYFDLPAASEIQFNRYGEVRKAPRLVQHVLRRVAPLYADREGGYTRIVKTGRHRLGDASDLVILQLVGREEGPQIGGGTSTRRRQADRRDAFAARLRKAMSDDAAPEEEPTTTADADDAAPDAAPVADAQADAETGDDGAGEAEPAPDEAKDDSRES